MLLPTQSPLRSTPVSQSLHGVILTAIGKWHIILPLVLLSQDTRSHSCLQVQGASAAACVAPLLLWVALSMQQWRCSRPLLGPLAGAPDFHCAEAISWWSRIPELSPKQAR